MVVDSEGFLEEHADEVRALSPVFTEDFSSWAEEHFGSSESASRILCAPYIYGFALQRKCWCKFFVNSLAPVEWRPEAMKSLILPDAELSLLRALVMSHRHSKNPRELSSQKGKGLVILLFGAPGSGKTLTAGMSRSKHSLILTNI